MKIDFSSVMLTLLGIMAVVVVACSIYYTKTNAPPLPCVVICVEGYQYLNCDSGVVQMMAGDGEEIYLVKCSNEDNN